MTGKHAQIIATAALICVAVIAWLIVLIELYFYLGR